MSTPNRGGDREPARTVRGRICYWNPRGFGFVAVGHADGIHFRADDALVDRPRVGDRVSFVVGIDDRGRKCAYDVQAIPLAELGLITGRIVRWNRFGFIEPDKGGPDVFFAPEDVRDGYMPATGDRVSFLLDAQPNHRRPGETQQIARLVGPVL